MALSDMMAVNRVAAIFFSRIGKKKLMEGVCLELDLFLFANPFKVSCLSVWCFECSCMWWMKWAFIYFLWLKFVKCWFLFGKIIFYWWVHVCCIGSFWRAFLMGFRWLRNILFQNRIWEVLSRVFKVVVSFSLCLTSGHSWRWKGYSVELFLFLKRRVFRLKLV